MNNVEKMPICKVLSFMGIPQHIRGWECITAALPYVVERMPIVMIYGRVASDLRVSPQRVERNIRTAAEHSVDRLGQCGIIEVYGNSLPMSGKPTNAQLLVTAARYWTGFAPSCGAGAGNG